MKDPNLVLSRTNFFYYFFLEQSSFPEPLITFDSFSYWLVYCYYRVFCYADAVQETREVKIAV